MSKKVYIIILTAIIILLGVSGFAWNMLQEDKIADSKAEVASLEDRSLPTPNSDLGENKTLPEEPSVQVSTPEETTPVVNNDNPTPIEAVTEPAPEPLPAPEPVTEEPIANEPQVLASNNFTSVGSYQTSGTTTVLNTNGQLSLNFGNDFSFSGAPDPVIYMCKDKAPNSVNNCIIISALNQNSGAQSFAITQDEYDQYSNPIIWCKAFGLLMGHTL